MKRVRCHQMAEGEQHQNFLLSSFILGEYSTVESPRGQLS
jgi:hypothetical protein